MQYNLAMSGHSKWSKVKHQKALKDPRKSKLFSQLTQQIQIAARTGEPDPDKNPTLRKSVEAARAANIPKDNIERAIAKGAGHNSAPGGAGLESITLEGYGPGGVAVMLQAETDNRNRTVAEVRRIFKQYEGSLGEPGSAAYVFGEDPENPQFCLSITDLGVRSRFDQLIGELRDHPDIIEVFNNLEN